MLTSVLIIRKECTNRSFVENSQKLRLRSMNLGYFNSTNKILVCHLEIRLVGNCMNPVLNKTKNICVYPNWMHRISMNSVVTFLLYVLIFTIVGYRKRRYQWNKNVVL